MASMGLTALGFAPEGFSTVTDAPRQGDLYMVKCGSSSDGSGLGYYHAGVYCSEEDEEIIHFTKLSGSMTSMMASCPGLDAATQAQSMILPPLCFTDDSSLRSSFSLSNSSSGPGIISKVHVKNFLGEYKFAIYRKNEGIPITFREKVRNAMQKKQEYDILDYNCIHFAMELLNVDKQGIDDYIKRMGKIIKNISKSQEMQPLPV
ncbi:uncharacterized protein LOC132846168 isoform X1 [Tachysurus vachellii]|uniref:uncharacterized protein LOC132846168 isoform X1 n=1 Tax=Tachysurus vachellii TaxID=175792 RepID=UPI00296B546E|nr:uncharacterized protein LOC132846168 isoform X1 [Tachysurus vachellii]XP_060726741.1 uncharacterized protein LOC132846168 isoform X1 [Tachysurus vachellii]